MSPDIDNNIDWTAATTPQDERMAVSLKLKRAPDRTLPTTPRGVMDTLLGQTDLTASDEPGKDPYNSTGRQFRR